MTDSKSIFSHAQALIHELGAADKNLATAESCTGGWIAKSLTDIDGSSRCFSHGIVSYSNDAKESLLGVDPSTILAHGAVSDPVVRAMAQGVLQLSGADFSVAVSGIAGPGGGTPDKPVGTVWFGFAARRGENISVDAELELLDGNRESIRAQTVILALQGIRERLKNSV